MGKVIIFSGPSGVGKGTIIKHIRTVNSELFADIITATSRLPRVNNGVSEIDGKDYYFFDEAEFRQKIKEGYFAEYEEVYPGKFYGTPLSSLQRIFNSNYLGTMDIDYKGALNLKALYPDQVVTVFVKPKSIQQLRERIAHRNPTIDDHDIDFRLLRAKEEIAQSDKFDFIINNDEWEQTVIDLKNFIETIRTDN